jgi:hypothetical protein
MRTFVAITVIAGSLALTGSAPAVLPVPSKKFVGVTSEHGINGFKPTVTFKTAVGGRALRNFVFQTVGCFGHGAFPVGVDPFADTMWRVASIPVAATGVVSAKLSPRPTRSDAGTMAMTITGAFASRTRLVGKVTFSQEQAGSDCGPQTVKFAATTS